MRTVMRARTVSAVVGLGLIAAVSWATPAAAADRVGAVTWGSNSEGQLGDGGTVVGRPTTGPVLGLPDTVTQTAAGMGAEHTLALLADGTVWAWGRNHDGELGDGTTSDFRTTPMAVPGLSGVIQVASGAAFSLALRSDGTVWSWGTNDEGQLGDGTFTSRTRPVQVRGLTGVRQIAAGFLDGLALLRDGTVRAWGSNDGGQLGDGTMTDNPTPVTVVGLTGVTQLGSDGDSTLALLAGGSVRAWGWNTFGQLGDGTTTNRPTPVPVPGLPVVQQVSISDHAVALLADGTVRTWGFNQYGELGDGTTNDRLTPGPGPALPPVIQVSAGLIHTLVLLADGTVRAWGSNLEGQLGDGTFTDRHTPVPVPGLSNVRRIVAGWFHNAVVVALPDFVIATSPAAGTATLGHVVTPQVRLTPLSGFTGSARLTVSGLPAGVTAAVNPGTVTADTPATLTLSTSGTSPVGTSTVTVTATDPASGVVHSTPYQLTITAAQTATVPSLIYAQGPDVAAYFLQNAGLTLGTVTKVGYLCNFAGSIIDQDPAPGAVVPVGSAVSVTYVDPDVCL